MLIQKWIINSKGQEYKKKIISILINLKLLIGSTPLSATFVSFMLEIGGCLEQFLNTPHKNGNSTLFSKEMPYWGERNEGRRADRLGSNYHDSLHSRLLVFLYVFLDGEHWCEVYS